MPKAPTARTLFIERMKREGKYEEWRRRYKEAKKDVAQSSMWTGLLVTKRNTSPTRICLLCAVPVSRIRLACRGLVQGSLIVGVILGLLSFLAKHTKHKRGINKHTNAKNYLCYNCKIHRTPPFLIPNLKTPV